MGSIIFQIKQNFIVIFIQTKLEVTKENVNYVHVDVWIVISFVISEQVS